MPVSMATAYFEVTRLLRFRFQKNEKLFENRANSVSKKYVRGNRIFVVGQFLQIKIGCIKNLFLAAIQGNKSCHFVIQFSTFISFFSHFWPNKLGRNC